MEKKNLRGYKKEEPSWKERKKNPVGKKVLLFFVSFLFVGNLVRPSLRCNDFVYEMISIVVIDVERLMTWQVVWSEECLILETVSQLHMIQSPEGSCIALYMYLHLDLQCK